MIFGDTSPYGELLTEQTHDDFSKDDEGIDIVLPEANAEIEEPSKDSVSYHLDNRIKILKTQTEEKLRNESLVNLVSFGVIGIVGFLIFKRYWK